MFFFSSHHRGNGTFIPDRSFHAAMKIFSQPTILSLIPAWKRPADQTVPPERLDNGSSWQCDITRRRNSLTGSALTSLRCSGTENKTAFRSFSSLHIPFASIKARSEHLRDFHVSFYHSKTHIYIHPNLIGQAHVLQVDVV